MATLPKIILIVCSIIPVAFAGGDHHYDKPESKEPTFAEQPADVKSTNSVLKGCWLFPDATSRVPCVVLVGGTLSHTRDGAFESGGEAGAQRDALRRMARQLAAAGYATLRWDKRGHGKTAAAIESTTNEM